MHRWSAPGAAVVVARHVRSRRLAAAHPGRARTAASPIPRTRASPTPRATTVPPDRARDRGRRRRGPQSITSRGAMPTRDRGRASRCPWSGGPRPGRPSTPGPVIAAADGTGLARLGHDGEDGPGPEEGGDGGGEGEAGHGVDVGKMALVDLLEPTGAVELDHLHVERVGEVGHGRIVEGEMPVLPDTETAQVEGVGRQRARRSGRTPSRDRPVRRCSGPARGWARSVIRSLIHRWNPAG